MEFLKIIILLLIFNLSVMWSGNEICILKLHICGGGFPGGSDSKEFARNTRDLGSIPGSGRSLGEGNDYPL